MPLGDVRPSPDRVDLDPDEQVRDVIRLVFEKHAEIGSVWGVFHYLVCNTGMNRDWSHAANNLDDGDDVRAGQTKDGRIGPCGLAQQAR